MEPPQRDKTVQPMSSTQFDLEAQAQDSIPPPRTPTPSVRTKGSSVGTALVRTWTEGSEKQTGSAKDSEPSLAMPWLDARPTLQHPASPPDEQNALLALPPPPSYDVVVTNLSIAIPTFCAHIPTPIPIPIPRAVTDTVRRWNSKDKESNANVTGSAGDGLIIRNVNAVVHRGEVMAIIGGSGSGKTTLLHAMAARLRDLPIAEGHVSITPSHSGGQDGAHPKGGEGHFKGMSKVVGFVKQHDYLLPHLTVRETLTYAAKLRLPSSVDSETRRLIVEQTIQELGLADAANTMVGGAGRKGISGGEKRRLSIGCVLVSFPSVIILDEVTTGLDSFTAFQLLETLDRLAKRGRTVILSLHQPRSDAFTLFSRILLMSHGSVVYSGRTGDCLPYFSQLGFQPSERTNPLDFLIDVSSIDTRDEDNERESKERLNRLVQCWREKEAIDAERNVRDARGRTSNCLSHFLQLGYQHPERANPLDVRTDASIVDIRDEDNECESKELRLDQPVQYWGEKETIDAEKDVLGGPPFPGLGASSTTLDSEKPAVHVSPTTTTSKRPNVLQQTTILVPRAFRNMTRGYLELVGHFLQAILVGLLMGVTYFQLGDQPNDIQSLKSLAFQVVPAYAYLTQIVWTFKWCNSLVVFDREQEDSLYSPVAWILSEFIAWLPMNVIAPSIFSILVYFISNMRRDDLHYNLGIFIIDMVLVQLSRIAWSLFSASIERSFARASVLGNVPSIFFSLSPGYLVVNVPGWIRWFRWISPHFFSFRIVVISQFRNRTFSCQGVTGPALAQCSGNNVLRGLRISPTEPLWPMFLGNLGFLLVITAFSCFLLTVWKPGGARHAQRVASDVKGKEISEAEIDIVRARVDVTAEHVGLFHVRRTLPSFKRVETPILADVSARFPSGEVSVIMGPSGSGKSTFLRMCAGWPIKGGLLSSFEGHGEIKLNGVPVSSRTRHICAFVEQDDDYHLPALTVRETLRFAAMIKLPSTVSRKHKIARAEEVLRMLGLRDCADGMVGGELLKGISGGEKRRLSLACQMINDPAVLIIDEPTSGLDANTARNVMEALQGIARSGRTVIASLHQPRSDIYNMVDNFVVLAKQGNVVYQGPREQLLPHFALVGYVCPPFYNPSDYCMDLISVDVRGQARQEQTSARVKFLVESWKTRQDKMLDYAASKSATSKEAVADIPIELEDRPEYTPIWIALPVVLDRTFRNSWRQPDIFWTRWTQAPILAICFFLFFLRLSNGPTGAQDRIGLVEECTTTLAYAGFANLAALYPMEKTVFFHDYKSAGGRYSSATFITAFTIFAIVPEFISALLFSVIMNVATGMQSNARIYFEFTVSVWIQLSFGESVGIAFASFFDTMGLSMSLVSVFLVVGSQASSILSASIARFLQDIAWIFPMKYGARTQLINEMQGKVFNCPPDTITNGECTAATGQQVLDLFGFHASTWHLVLISIAVIIGYRVATWGILSVRMRYI
ncbi:uncharacterized protein PHACADRAFT_208320 [Phanerochaete carnosa HHB-10118-sp]|uniref:ABC transporter domain-containing protein n=1 Tax=Phanerochaete carnosa (strain HHB-10118-sp) TaxID=650164 RepID=K5X303_PHACS|nr:uncharacterized protein PHACADRAFT_208320 [Phanerochaete carnosa HHB-10118-sp]EKM57187.1 hypothetical protein PHACADRAFT_208320 [Phanerochaete carnosa HHB-10118-sp]